MHQPFIRQWGTNYTSNKIDIIKFPISYKNFCRIYINQITSTPDDIKQVNVYNKTLTEFYRQQGYASNISVDWVSIGK
jgi:hypothetical protein